MLYDEVAGLPASYIATSGFDPLRDEGEAYARKPADAGVPVILRRHPGSCTGSPAGSESIRRRGRHSCTRRACLASTNRN
ncbi:hypothetical protein BS329_24450 [Amycolatopsis coloradensis]|uniref:Alpha/beta hydrolase fold-3 domain-containing protein n=1 Tax=Amycolatopsis coloradensis TaxID=76021 RepID=A0A1R0KN62_9PSEU|nr:hypothetical protein BS329_24450 [Amycolatopsis coloradensis]